MCEIENSPPGIFHISAGFLNTAFALDGSSKDIYIVNILEDSNKLNLMEERIDLFYTQDNENDVSVHFRAWAVKYWGFLNSGFSTWNATQSMHSIYLELYTLPCRSWGLVKWHKLCDSGTIAIALNNKLSFVSNPGVYFVFSVSICETLAG